MKITGNCVVEVWRKRHERGRTNDKRTIRRRNPTFSEDLSGDPSFPQLEIYQILMKNGEKSTRGRAAIIIGNGKHPVITV